MSETHSLLIAGADFRRATSRFYESPIGVAVGVLRRRQIHNQITWSLDQVKWHDQPPTGSEFAPIADWCVIRRLSEDAATIHDKHEMLQPLPGQNLVVLTLANNDQGLGGWSATRLAGGKIYPIEEVRIIGAPNLVLSVSPINPNSAEFDIEHPRWSRLRNMWGDKNLLRVANTHVMIIGASRTGSVVARQLTALGIGKLTLVDPDMLEIHNYDAMMGGSMDDIGRSKVAALADELVRFRDDIAVTGLPFTATDRRVIQRARIADVLITCVDHGTPVLFAAKMANRWNKVHIDIGTSVQKQDNGELEITGDVRFFQPHEACASCVGGIGDRIDAEIDLQLPAGAQPLRPQVDFRDQRAGSLITINAMTVSIATQLLTASLCGGASSSYWYRLVWTVKNQMQCVDSNMFRENRCIVCR